MKLEPIFLIGAAKAGTTSLAQALGAHPAIAELAIKEPGHFCSDLRSSDFSPAYNTLLAFDEERYFGKPSIEQRHIAFVSSVKHYEKLQHDAASQQSQARYFLDASTAYLYSERAAAELQASYPAAKVIVVLRNPVSRAYSHYNMARKYGMERRSALEAFTAESRLDRAQWGVDECYLELGKYADQLERYFNHFDRSQVLVLFHEDLKHQPNQVLERVASFLELAPFAEGISQEQNKAEVPRSKASAALAGALKGSVRNNIPPAVKRLGKRMLFGTPDSLDGDARSLLVHYFAAENKKLERLLDIDLNHWK